jgi:hypothetical protein
MKYLKTYKELKESLNEREYSDKERASMASKGLALPDGSFPIKDLQDLKNAIQAYGRSKNQSAAAKFIVKRANALSADDLIPDTKDFKDAISSVNEKNNVSLNSAIAILKRENIMAYPNPEDLAKAIHKHYKEITGEKYKDAVDMSMDDSIADIVSYFKIDGSDFMSAWDKTIKD